MSADPTTVPLEDFDQVLSALEEASRLLRLAGTMLDHSSAGIDWREETIARQVAMLDQRDAALAELAHQHRSAWTEVERLRRVCRAAGVDHTTGGAA